jgi:integrase
MPRRSPGDGTLFQRKSDNMWVAGYTVMIDGRSVQKRVSSKTRNGAIQKRKELKKQLDAGIVPGAVSMRLDKWLDHWLHDIKKPRVDPTTFRSYELAVRAYIKPTVGHKRLDLLNPDDVRRMHVTLQARSTRNAQKAHQVLAMALKAAQAELNLPRNVAELVGMPAHIPKRHPAFTPDQALHIMAVADSSCDAIWSARWKAGFMTGKRECELLGLTWDRVDLQADLIDVSWQLQELIKVHQCGEPVPDPSYPKGLRFPCGKKRVSSCPEAVWDFPVGFEHRLCVGNLVWTKPKSKSTTEVRIPIIPPLHDILEQLQEVDGPNPHNLVFHHPDGAPIAQRQDQKAWQQLLRTAEVPHVGQHTLRRTTATLMRAAAVDEQTRMELFGHASTDVQRRYADPNVERHREAMGRLADILAPQNLDD